MEGVGGVMKDKTLKFDEIEDSHTRWGGSRSRPGEREVERL